MQNRTLGQSERYRRANLAKKYHLGLQYEGKKGWDEDAPLHERKPKIVVPLFANAVAEAVSFTWGGEQFPTLTVAATRKPGQSTRDIGPAVTPDEATDLSGFIASLVQTADFAQLAHEFSTEALVTNHCAVVLYAQGGFLRWLVQDGKDCTPVFSKTRPFELESLDICYRYKREQATAFGTIAPLSQQKEFWYRRVIDEQRDVTYKEVEVTQGQIQPAWEEDPDKTVEHKLGFCPARWIRTFPESNEPIEGRPFIDPVLYSLLDDVNYQLSLRSRAVAYGSNPQPIRKGVGDDKARVVLDKNPGKVWDLPADGDLKFAEIQGKGAEAVTAHLDDLTRRFREAVRVVMADPALVRGDVSGPVMQYLHRPMIALASHLRHDFGVRGLGAVLNTALRMVGELSKRGEIVYVPGVLEAGPKILAAQQQGEWLDFPINFDWPAFFRPSEEEKQKLIAVASAAHATGMISIATAARPLHQLYGVKDAEAEIQKAQQEIADAQARAKALSPKGVPTTPTVAVPVGPSPDAQAAADSAAQAETDQAMQLQAAKPAPAKPTPAAE